MILLCAVKEPRPRIHTSSRMVMIGQLVGAVLSTSIFPIADKITTAGAQYSTRIVKCLPFPLDCRSANLSLMTSIFSTIVCCVSAASELKLCFLDAAKFSMAVGKLFFESDGSCHVAIVMLFLTPHILVSMWFDVVVFFFFPE